MGVFLSTVTLVVMISWWIFVIQPGERVLLNCTGKQMKQSEKKEILVCGPLQGQRDENTEVETVCPGSFL